MKRLVKALWLAVFVIIAFATLTSGLAALLLYYPGLFLFLILLVPFVLLVTAIYEHLEE